ncbi:TrmB family transcriptional regulator [Candidatus Bathyarchaeota archaeon]|nr:TrmB family transcriptional regulator [Candidatus Bathyarchaeota archaeon]
MERLAAKETVYLSGKTRKAHDALNLIGMIEENLIKFGLQKNEAKIFLFLARTGEKKAREISEALSLYRTETYQALRSLEKKGLVFSVFGRPLKFKAIPLEKAINLLIEAKRLEIEKLKQEKRKIVEVWLSIPRLETKTETKKEIFQILEGNEQVFLKINGMLERTRCEIYIYASEYDLRKLYNARLTEKLNEVSEKGVKVNLLTNDSSESLFFLRSMNANIDFWLIPRKNSVISPYDLEPPFFLISDKEELLLLLRRDNYQKNRKKLNSMALWTNCDALIKTFYILFLELRKRFDK